MSAAPHSQRMTLSRVVERMTERRTTSSVTLKQSAQGVFMPEVTIALGESQDAVDVMVAQAVGAYAAVVAAGVDVELHTRLSASVEQPAKPDKPRRVK